MNSIKIIALSGPTATGKTKLSIDLAKELSSQFGLCCGVINFDSLLFYRELKISTARPDQDEMQGVAHYLVGERSVQDPLNAADFVHLADALIAEKSHQIYFLVGGSGFYLRAFLEGMYESQTTPESLRQEIEQLYEREGITPFAQELAQNDPESAKRLHPNDHYRIKRAVEHWRLTGETLSSSTQKWEESHLELHARAKQKGYEVLHLHIDVDKTLHRNIIEKRTQSMLDQGLIEEIKSLLQEKNLTGQERPLQSVGPKEVQAYLRGEIPDQKALKERINISTWQLAKAQRTWFKKVDKFSFQLPEQKDLLKKQLFDFLKLSS